MCGVGPITDKERSGRDLPGADPRQLAFTVLSVPHEFASKPGCPTHRAASVVSPPGRITSGRIENAQDERLPGPLCEPRSGHSGYDKVRADVFESEARRPMMEACAAKCGKVREDAGTCRRSTRSDRQRAATPARRHPQNRAVRVAHVKARPTVPDSPMHRLSNDAAPPPRIGTR